MKILTAVTPNLARILAETGDFLTTARTKGDRLNDETDFQPVVKALEKLAIVLLNSGGTDALIGKRLTGARFDLGAGANVYETLSDIVEYLRTEVPGQLNGPLDRYRALHADRALGYLTTLHDGVVDGIARQARADLDKVAEKHIGWLLIAAGELAASAELARTSAPAAPWVKEEFTDQPG